jgi:hypothetical protein
MAKKPGHPKPYQVFVSHATADKWLARMICEKVEATGASTFRDDRDIDGGDDIPERIRAEIKRSREIVVLLTPHSVNRPWVLVEVGAAWCHSKSMRILPILCHVEADSIPDMIKSRKATPLNDCDELFAEIASRVRKHHGEE